MARGVNKAILIGHLGQDPEVRYSANGTAIANCSLATTESWKDKQSGDKVEKTEWHRIVFFARLAEIVGEYLKKGSQVYVEGRLQTRKWQDKEGHDRYTTEIVVSDMQMLGSRQGTGAPPSGMDDYAPASSNKQGSKPAAANAPSAYDEFDDDIPF